MAWDMLPVHFLKCGYIVFPESFVKDDCVSTSFIFVIDYS